ncbi:MAG: methyltransferase [Candidatus Aenigmarchaeota archaeon]|nr:methyltransferase [Candidatus Aenigmarchaeota archaeon]MDI6722337.1 methyltransferase [Candidatus Aenigmarchaeota archaeon]
MRFVHEDLELEIPENVYYPAEDTFLLVDVIENLHMKDKKVLDVGCGSGFLSLLCASKGAGVTAVDIDEDAVEAAKANSISNDSRISALVSDLFEKVSGVYDYILFNPPYLPKEEDEDSDITYTGGATGREIIERFISQCKNHLSENGKVFLVISSLTGQEEVFTLFNENGFSVKVVAKEKIDWEELIAIEAVRYG